MGKRSDFERIPRDKYPTPASCVPHLLPHVPAGASFIEPCAGNGQLMDYLVAGGLKCLGGWDIEPQRKGIKTADSIVKKFPKCDFLITNPPWKREILHPMILNFSNQAPTWLLFDSDWAYNQKSSVLMKRCLMIVAVGRVKWFPESEHTGKENASWYLFANGPRQLPGPILINER